MIKLYKTLILITWLLCKNAWGHVTFDEYEVLRFESVNAYEYEVELVETKSKKYFFVSLRFRPKCFSRMDYGTTVNQEKEIFEKSVALLEGRLQKSRTQIIGRKSGSGFIRVPEKENTYEAESLRITVSPEGEEFLYFNHSDIGYGRCKNA